MIKLQALRPIIVGVLLLSLLAACGGTAGTGASTASEAAAGVSAAVSAAEAEVSAAGDETAQESAAASMTPSMEAEASMDASMEAGASTEASANAEASAAGSAEAEASAAGNAEEVTLPEVDPASVEGDVVTSGSSTVFPLAQRMAERFGEEGYGGTVSVDEIGSGAGFERFCTAGETDIANASRAIKEEESAACAALSPARTPLEFRIGTDAVTVAVSNENDFLTDISKDDLQRIFTGEVKTWDQLDPSYPAEAIQLFAPGTDSGTYDFFNEVILEGDEANIAAFQGLNPSQSENDNVLVQGIEASPDAIGYFGFAYYQENESRLKAISIDGVVPELDTAESGEYILSRPLFMYSDATIMQEKPQVAAFLNFVLSYVNDEIEDVGYFPASAASLNEARQKWIDAAGE